MALSSAECKEACKEEADFSMKFIITSLESGEDLKGVFVVLSFDGNVVKFNNLEKNDDGDLKMVGHELLLQLSPEKFSEKMHTCPIMFDLNRGCDEVGSFKLDVSECFSEAVKCDEFSSETSTSKQTFMKDGEEVGEMGLIFQVTRPVEDQAVKKLKQLMRKKMEKKKNANSDESSIDFDEQSISCDTDLYPIEEESEIASTSCPCSSSCKSNTKCCNDIAASLDISDFADDQKTFCCGCGGFSISGITCDNKSLVDLSSRNESSECFPSSDSTESVQRPKPCQTAPKKSSQPCKVSSKQSTKPCVSKELKPRVCSECFENLTALPNNEPCPKCKEHEQLPRKLVSLKSDSAKMYQEEGVREHFKSIFEELFMETKDQLMKDWNRLKKPAKKKSKKGTKNQKRSQEVKLRCPPKKFPKRNIKYESQGLRPKIFGVVLGHRSCHGSGIGVPKTMGWQWNTDILGLQSCQRKGWRPGAIRKSVIKIMKHYLAKEPKPEPLKCEEKPPTLRVEKKHGQYIIVMNPVRDEKKCGQNLSPIVFKIEKSCEAKARSKARKMLKCRGVEKKCECSSAKECKCLDECQKASIQCELSKVSKALCIKPELSYYELRDSSDSEVDVEYTPPSAELFRNPCKMKKAVKVSFAGTQYEVQRDMWKDEDGEGNEKDDGNSDEGAEKEDTNKGRRRVQQVVKMGRNFPTKVCCSFCAPSCNNFGCQDSYNHRFSTNYNPMYAQCPAQPPTCADQCYMHQHCNQIYY